MRSKCIIGRGVRIIRISASGFCVSCSPVRDSLESGGPGASCLRPLTTDGQPCGGKLTQKSLAGPLGTPGPRPIRYSHLTKRPAVARATAGKVLAAGCTRQGQSTRRGLSSPSMRGITSTTWSVDRASWPSSSSSWQRRCHLRPSRSGWPWAASWLAPARHTRLRTTEGTRRARERLRQPS